MNVRRPSCGVLEWDPPSGASEGLTYKIRFYGGQSFWLTPSNKRRVLSSSTNSLSFTAGDVPSARPLNAIVSYVCYYQLVFHYPSYCLYIRSNVLTSGQHPYIHPVCNTVFRHSIAGYTGTNEGPMNNVCEHVRFHPFLCLVMIYHQCPYRSRPEIEMVFIHVPGPDQSPQQVHLLVQTEVLTTCKTQFMSPSSDRLYLN